MKYMYRPIFGITEDATRVSFERARQFEKLLLYNHIQSFFFLKNFFFGSIMIECIDGV